MASCAKFIFLSLFISFSLASAQTSSPKPKAFILPISKDASTLQYLTHVDVGTPFVRKQLVLDLGSQHFWIDCDTDYNSSTYRPGRCGSAACSFAKAPCIGLCPRPASPGCNNNTCKASESNVFGSEISLDKITIRSTVNGHNVGPMVDISNFIFVCQHNWTLTGLPKDSNGVMGLGKERVAFPSQLSAIFGGSAPRKFGFCLPPNPENTSGILYFGDSSYHFYPGYNFSKTIDVSKRLQFTKLHTAYRRTATPRIQGEPIPEYFVKITSILVNGKPIPINRTLLEFSRSGIGGSRITITQPYTIVESSIYDSLVKAFDKEIAISKVKKVAPVEPFRDCYTKGNLGMSILGLSVPDITFVFENRNVAWNIYGANSMVEVSNDVICLGFVRGVTESWTTTSIDVGAHQMQDNLIHFDLAASRMGFSETLLLEESQCSYFAF